MTGIWSDIIKEGYRPTCVQRALLQATSDWRGDLAAESPQPCMCACHDEILRLACAADISDEMQAFNNGLEHFLSNAPGDNLNDVAEFLESTTNGGEIVVRTMNGTAIPRHGPALGMYPSFLTFDPEHRQATFTYL